MKDISTKMIEDFAWYFEKGYITPRDGNVCYKMSSTELLITASGVEKQKMSANDILLIDSEGHCLSSSAKPSIETAGHLIALSETNTKASVHVHSLETVALFSLAYKKNFLELLEKNLRTQWAELFRYTKIGKTVDYLPPGSKALHDGIADSFKENGIDIIVLDQHGVIAVGDSLDECKEHIIRLEHVSKMVLKMLMASNGDTNILK